MKCSALTLLIVLAIPARARLGEPTNISKPESEESKVEATAGFRVQSAAHYSVEDPMNNSVSKVDEESLPNSELLNNVSMTLNLLAAVEPVCDASKVQRRRRNKEMCSCRRRSSSAASENGWRCSGDTMALEATPMPSPSVAPVDRSLMGGYSSKATTTRYGDAGASACGSVSTAELVAGTDYYNVASAQAMWGGDCCWCGKSGGGGGTTGLGCFSCAKGRFLNHHGGFASGEINIVVGDLCPHAGNERWCPARPGDVNSEGAHNHLDFSRPPSGIDNNIFVFRPSSCSRELRHRYEKLSQGRCR